MKVEQSASLLGRTELFRDLDEDVLLSLAAGAIQRTYKRGQLIVGQGEPGDSLFVLLEGMVKVIVASEEGNEMVLATLRPPDTFGELAVIDGGTRSASAEAFGAAGAGLLILTRQTLLTALAKNPTVTDALLRSLGNLVRRLTEQAADLVFLDLHGRVAKLLLGLAERDAAPEGEHATLDLGLTQTDLAEMVGGSRQSINGILQSFERRGYIEVRGRNIAILRPDLLRHRAGG